MGKSYWELLGEEHDIGMDARFNGRKMNDDTFLNFYNEDRMGRYRPRSIFIDTDNTIMNRTKKLFGNLHCSENFINGIEDAADNYARGCYTIGKEIVDEGMEQIRRTAEQCDVLDGF